MKSLKLKDNLYWTGILDPDLRVFDIIMNTKFGTTYNSYVLKGSEKTALFETAKLNFLDEFFDKVSEVTDIASIDYLIVNHTEPDHAGSIEKLLELNPTIQIVGTMGAIGFLKNIVNREFNHITVKDGMTLSLGDKTITFMPLPNLHWPDTMFSYVEEDKLLFTCDVFGSHYSYDGILRSNITDTADYMEAVKYYFDMIIRPFKNPYMTNALKRIEGLEFDMICTGHGPVLDSNIEDILSLYREWCAEANPNNKTTVIISYVSAYGYTKTLAGRIAEGVGDSGDVDVRVYDMVTADVDTVVKELLYADGILFGTPTIVGQALEPIWELTLKMSPATHAGKLASAFGSFGWSGEGVPHILERLKQLKLKVYEDGFRVKFKPSDDDLENAYKFGHDFGTRLINK